MALSACRPKAPAAGKSWRRSLWLAVAMLWLVTASALLPLSAEAADDITPAQRKAFEGLVHDYLMNHPDVLLDALQNAEDKIKSDAQDKAAAALTSHKKDVFDDPGSPVGGNPKGDVSLVEFFDYRCPYCKQMEPALEKLLGSDHDLRFVYKEFPILGDDSVAASRAALASRKQGKYDAFHRALMNLKGAIDEPAVMKVAASVGLDTARLKRDMAGDDIDRMLKANLDLADALDVHGTPGFIVGDQIVASAVSFDSLKKLIDTARQKKPG
jgi:protein-disulfide isomerase